jgi:hypothetical protein
MIIVTDVKYTITNLFTSIIIIIIMALQPFVGPWPPFQFPDPIHSL